MKNKIKKLLSILSVAFLSVSFVVLANNLDVESASVSGSLSSGDDYEYTYEYDGGTFVNYYISSVDVELTANKILNDKSNTRITLEDGMFEFELYLDEELISTATNNSDGLITFDTLTFSEEGEHSVIIKEIAGTDEHITYDDTVISFTLTVELVDYEFVITFQ